MLLQKQDKQREGEKLYSTDKGHAVIRAPNDPAQVKEDYGDCSEKRSAVRIAENLPVDQEQKQSAQNKTDQSRAPRKETSKQVWTEEKEPLQCGKDTRRCEKGGRDSLSHFRMIREVFLGFCFMFFHNDESTSKIEKRNKQVLKDYLRCNDMQNITGKGNLQDRKREQQSQKKAR